MLDILKSKVFATEAGLGALAVIGVQLANANTISSDELMRSWQTILLLIALRAGSEKLKSSKKK